MLSLLLSIFCVYLIYTESNFYLYFISDILKSELDLDEDYLINNIYIKKNYNTKIIKDKEIQCKILTEDKGVQCDLYNELNDDLVIL